MTLTERYVFTVKDLSRYLKGLLERDATLRDLWVRGEISNFVAHSSGHLYFTLKDEWSQVRCVCFREQACRLPFAAADGMRVLCHGSVTVYERAGQHQLYVSEMRADGVGALFAAFEKLKARLQAEGLFETSRKRPLPRYPRRIGVLTSPHGAALHDFITILRRRWPPADILLVPVQVAGAGAAASIQRGLARAAAQPGLEVLVLTRGGGSLEELWPFNEERVARAIASSPLPVVSAVGHETDFTIADFVADLRAPTPSAAAELLGPDMQGLLSQVAQYRERTLRALTRAASGRRQRLQAACSRRPLVTPLAVLAPYRQRLDDGRAQTQRAIREALHTRRSALREACAKVALLGPDSVLRRGYTITRTVPDGAAASIATLRPGMALEVIFHDGATLCRSEQVRPGAGQWRRSRDAQK